MSSRMPAGWWKFVLGFWGLVVGIGFLSSWLGPDKKVEWGKQVAMVEGRAKVLRGVRARGHVRREHFDMDKRAWVEDAGVEARGEFEGGLMGMKLVEYRARVKGGPEAVEGGGVGPWRGFLLDAEGWRVRETAEGAWGDLAEDEEGDRDDKNRRRPLAAVRAEEATGWRWASYGDCAEMGCSDGLAGLMRLQTEGTGVAGGATTDEELRDGVYYLKLPLWGFEKKWVIFVDAKRGYTIGRWERYWADEADLRHTRLLESAEVKEFWDLGDGVFYPKVVEVREWNMDGAATFRERVEVEEVRANDKEAEKDLGLLKLAR